MKMLSRTLFFLLFTIGLSACKEPATEEAPSTSAPGQITISYADDSPDQGRAKGPHRLSFTNYPASEILRRVANRPLQYAATTDPVLTLDYYFPDQPLAEARPQAVNAVVDFLQLELDTIQAMQPALVLSAADFQPRQLPDQPDGVKARTVNNTVYLYDASLAELAEQLQKNRPEYVVSVTANKCCTDFTFPNLGDLAALSSALFDSGGVKLDTTRKSVATLRVID